MVLNWMVMREGKEQACFCRSIVPDGPVPGWDIPDLWNRGNLLRSARRRGPSGPRHLHLPANDQVHVPQVWHVRRYWEPWRPVYPTRQHRQWEDLCLSVVLVPPADLPDIHGGLLSTGHHSFAKNASLLALHPVQANQKRVHQHNHPKSSDGRLFPTVHAGTKRGLDDIQRSHSWTGQEAWIPVKRLDRLLVKQYFECTFVRQYLKASMKPSATKPNVRVVLKTVRSDKTVFKLDDQISSQLTSCGVKFQVTPMPCTEETAKWSQKLLYPAWKICMVKHDITLLY